jgi:hypothetical protein
LSKSKSVRQSSSAGSSSLSHGEGIIEEFWDAKLRDEFVFGQDTNPQHWKITQDNYQKVLDCLEFHEPEVLEEVKK